MVIYNAHCVWVVHFRVICNYFNEIFEKDNKLVKPRTIGEILQEPFPIILLFVLLGLMLLFIALFIRFLRKVTS